jgi:carbon-monoxide dehydrogenase large subunit
VTVFTGSHSHGQGHETTFAQGVAAKLGMPVENVEIVHGDTGRVPFGMGTYGSRSLAVGGTAIVKAVDKIIAKGKKIAAHLLEAADTDIEFENGEFKVKGTDKKVPFGSVSLTAYVPHNFPLDRGAPRRPHRARLALGPPQPERCRARRDGRGAPRRGRQRRRA